MDPNETLKELREEMQWVDRRNWDGEKAKELFNALDEWLTKGGFYPKDWDKHRLVEWNRGYVAGREDAIRNLYNPGMGS